MACVRSDKGMQEYRGGKELKHSAWSINNQVTNFLSLESFPIPKVTRLLIGIDMPDHVVWQTKYLVPCALRHTSEPFGFGLVFESIGGEVDTYQKLDIPQNIRKFKKNK